MINKSNVFLISAFLGISLSGCATAPKSYHLENTFNARKAKAQLQNGPNTIKGSAVIRQIGGTVVTCAGNKVLLIPDTSYAEKRMEIIYGSKNNGYLPATKHAAQIEPHVRKYETLEKSTICDAQGYFEFDHLANGGFYIITDIVWNPGEYTNTQGGALMKRVYVNGGETKHTVLTP